MTIALGVLNDITLNISNAILDWPLSGCKISPGVIGAPFTGTKPSQSKLKHPLGLYPSTCHPNQNLNINTC